MGAGGSRKVLLDGELGSSIIMEGGCPLLGTTRAVISGQDRQRVATSIVHPGLYLKGVNCPQTEAKDSKITGGKKIPDRSLK